MAFLLLAAPLQLAHAQDPAAPAQPRIAMLGDSLTAGYGLPAEDALPVQLQAALAAQGAQVTILNAGVSGDTTAGGLARLDWMLEDKPAAVLVALGSNDGLRGIDPAATRANLTQILDRLQAKGVPVMLVGMLAPPNLGPEYGRDFDAAYPALATEKGVPLYPFILDGVVTDPALNQADGIHPNAAGAKIVAERMAPAVKAFLQEKGLIPPA